MDKIEKIGQIMAMLKFFLGLILGILSPIIIGLSTYLWIYHANDVNKLMNHYPQVKIEKDYEFSITLVKKKPDNWTRLNQVSEYLKWAVIVKEDWDFFHHDGIDVRELKIAINDYLDKGKRLRGASTLTQQLVKNVFFESDRSYWRKLKEIIYAYKLDKVATKNLILEHYLNIVEFGPNIYGVKNAAKYYFKTTPSQLTPKQAAFLAVLLPSPVKYSQSFRQKELTEYIKFEIDRVLIKLRQAKIFEEDDRIMAIKECFSWEVNCNPDSIVDRLSRRTKNPRLPNYDYTNKNNEADEDTHTQQL